MQRIYALLMEQQLTATLSSALMHAYHSGPPRKGSSSYVSKLRVVQKARTLYCNCPCKYYENIKIKKKLGGYLELCSHLIVLIVSQRRSKPVLQICSTKASNALTRTPVASIRLLGVFTSNPPSAKSQNLHGN